MIFWRDRGFIQIFSWKENRIFKLFYNIVCSRSFHPKTTFKLKKIIIIIIIGLITLKPKPNIYKNNYIYNNHIIIIYPKFIFQDVYLYECICTLIIIKTLSYAHNCISENWKQLIIIVALKFQY